MFQSQKGHFRKRALLLDRLLDIGKGCLFWKQIKWINPWLHFPLVTRVAGWYIFIPNITIYVNFVGYCNGRCWNILWPFCLFHGHLVGILYGHLVYLLLIWYIFPILVYCTKKNLSTLPNITILV
jgi:hypothetical protein